MIVKQKILPLLTILLLVSCTHIKVSDSESLHIDTSANLPEAALLDIVITTLDPLLEDLDPELGPPIDGMRFAESRYLSWQLGRTLQDSAHWGRVTVQPSELAKGDLHVSGRILQSDGQTLRLEIQVQDSAERLWFTRQYLQIVHSKDRTGVEQDQPFAFNGMLNRIANDIQAWQDQRMQQAALIQLRQLTDMQFALASAPDIYNDYVQENDSVLSLKRLPAVDDPVYERIAEIRLRNDSLVDVLQDNYNVFVRNVEEPYLSFLDRSLRITELINAWLIREMYSERYNEFTDEDWEVPVATRFSNFRSPVVKSRSNSLNAGWRSQFYALALSEAGQSLEDVVQPDSEDFYDRIDTIVNGASSQFQSWNLILSELNALESGARSAFENRRSE